MVGIFGASKHTPQPSTPSKPSIADELLKLKKLTGAPILFGNQKKAPVHGKDWQKTVLSDEDVVRLASLHPNGGALMGFTAEGWTLCSLDFDSPYVYGMFCELLPEWTQTWTCTTPSGGYRMLFWTDEPYQGKPVKDIFQLEYLGHNQYAGLYGKALNKFGEFGEYRNHKHTDIILRASKLYSKTTEVLCGEFNRKYACLTYNCVRSHVKASGEKLIFNREQSLAINAFMMINGASPENVHQFRMSVVKKDGDKLKRIYKRDVTDTQIQSTREFIDGGGKPPTCESMKTLFSYNGSCDGCPRVSNMMSPPLLSEDVNTPIIEDVKPPTQIELKKPDYGWSQSEYTEKSPNLIHSIDIYLREGLLDSEPDWTESVATILVGLVNGLDRALVNRKGFILSNLYAIVIDKSRIGEKTLPIKKAKKLAEKLADMLNMNLYSTMSEDDIKEARRLKKKTGKKTEAEQALIDSLNELEEQLVEFCLPERFSAEGISSYMTKENKNKGAIFGDEFTAMVKGSKTKDYLATLLEDLSRMFDNNMVDNMTTTRGHEKSSGTHISLISATTPLLYQLLDDTFWIQGTGNRILFTVGKKKKVRDTDKDVDDSDNFFCDNEESSVEEAKTLNMVGNLYQITMLPRGVIKPDEEASLMLRRYMFEKRNAGIDLANSKDDMNAEGSAIVGMPLMAFKLALVHCVGRYAVMNPQPVDINEMKVNKEDCEWAFCKVERHYQDYLLIKEKMLKYSDINSYRSRYREFTKVLNIVDKPKFAEGVGKRDIGRYCNWDGDETQRILDTMVSVGYLDTKVVNEKKILYLRGSSSREV